MPVPGIRCDRPLALVAPTTVIVRVVAQLRRATPVIRWRGDTGAASAIARTRAAVSVGHRAVAAVRAAARAMTHTYTLTHTLTHVHTHTHMCTYA